MAYVSTNQDSPDQVDVVVTYRTSRTGVPVHLVCSANDWVPIEMTAAKESKDNEIMLEAPLKVQRGTGTIIYKFRIGHHEWVYDTGAPTEPDGFNGMNNRFDIPADLPPTPPPESPAVEEREEEEEAQTPRPAEDDLSEILVSPTSSAPEPVSVDQVSFPSPAQSPREHDIEDPTTREESNMVEQQSYQDESGTEVEAPSEPDWEPSSEEDGEQMSSHGDQLSEPEMLANQGSPTSSSGGGFPISYFGLVAITAILALLYLS